MKQLLQALIFINCRIPFWKKDVIGKIDNEARTITLLLPKGTDVSRLTPNMDYGAGSGSSFGLGFCQWHVA